jgi:hypothetical protein
LVRSVFGTAIDPAPVRIRRRRWFPFQPIGTLMAPTGHIHFHPRSSRYCDDFGAARIEQQALFIHEMTHVWQTQTRGKWYLPLMRNPWSPYDYVIKPGWKLNDYGLEQQAEIVRHAFLLLHGKVVPGAPTLKTYQQILPFPGTSGC